LAISSLAVHDSAHIKRYHISLGGQIKYVSSQALLGFRLMFPGLLRGLLGAAEHVGGANPGSWPWICQVGCV
jgi:hypothetical protein